MRDFSRSAVLPNSALTSDEIDRATRYLHETRDDVVALTKGLTDAQWNFKPESECWSIAATVEHLTLIEQAIHGIVARIPEAPEPPAGWNQAEVDAFIPARIPARTSRVKGPPFLEPTGRWRGEEGLALFENGRASSVELLSTSPGLRGHVIPHPVLGPWDGYQWLLSVAAHCARHAGQIRETQAAQGYPR